MDYLNNINKFILSSGLKKSFIAYKLGIKYETFRKKLNGQTEFKISELEKLTQLLNINIMEVFKNGKEN